jgi:eukaryotic-like serine/threonine-protein kinase
MTIGIGQSLGNYRVMKKLGAGGMGAVYLAEHPLIGKKVALKVIHRELSMNREVVARFFNEARAVNQIGNDHIVDISDFGQTPEGEYFFIMELLAGKSLGDVLEAERRLAIPRALHVTAQIADALAASHAVGIIHRDLKPDNVFLVNKLGEPDFVKLLDFGLAKLTGASPQHLTKQGVILGTPQYMSPEQCESKGNIDYRTDIYSLGILLYQMVTGRLPFDGGTMGEILVKQVAHPVVAPRSVSPDVPPAVEQIVMRCLAKRPGERFQSMGELRAALLDPDAWMQLALAATAAQGVPAIGGGGAVAGRLPALSPPPEVATALEMHRPPPLVPAVAASPGQGAASLLVGGGARGGPAAAFGGPSRAMPALAAPAPVSSSTLRLDPRVAAGRRPRPRRRWPVAAAFVALAAAVTTVALLAAQRASSAPSSPTAASPSSPAAAPLEAKAVPTATPGPAGPPPQPPTPPPSAPPPGAPPSSVAGPVPASRPASTPVVEPLPPPPPPRPARVTLSFATDPPGADVIDETTGDRLGTTPLDLPFDRDSERTFRFRRRGYEEKRKTVRVSADAEILIVLDRSAVRSQRHAPPPRAAATPPPPTPAPAPPPAPPPPAPPPAPPKPDPNTELLPPKY